VDKLNGSFNLLTAPYSRKSKGDWQWRQWLPMFAVALLALLIQTGIFFGDYWQKKSQLSTLETQNLALFKQTFPDVKRVVNIKVQAEQQLNDLKKQATNGSQFIRLLYQSGELLTAHSSFLVQQMVFMNGSLQISFTVSDRSQVDAFKQELESRYGLVANILSAEAGQQGVEANLEIREK
jgi:general secretion pathway protein L